MAKAHPPRKFGKKPADKPAAGTDASPADKSGSGKDKKGVKSSAGADAKAATGSGSKSKNAKAEGAAGAAVAAAEEAPKKPTVRQLIGGASWTGKLPVDLLSEHCQRQKWNPPEYGMRGNAQKGFIATVTLRQKNQKTGEITVLPPFKVPDSLVPQATQPTSLEARHFAAAYTLFRVCSMKNMHMTLPLTYRDLWKTEFHNQKQEDTNAGRAWLYEADPFQTRRDRDEEKAKKAREIEEREKRKEKEEKEGPSLKSSLPKAWTQAPSVELGKRMRTEIERLIRQNGEWNPGNLPMKPGERKSATEKFVKLGFRSRHCEEAADICRDSEEMFEWLLINVPEDDLPPWALPEKYVAGVAKVELNVKRQKTVQRLASGGYAVELCGAVFDCVSGDERAAMEIIQSTLLEGNGSDLSSGWTQKEAVTPDPLSSDVVQQWEEEVEVLASIFGERMAEINGRVELKLENRWETTLTFFPSSQYPNSIPILGVNAKLPAYVKLAITKQALEEARRNYIGEAMVFGIVDWIEANMERIVENPGRLSMIQSSTPQQTSNSTASRRIRNSNRRKASTRDTREGSEASMAILSKTIARNKTADQIKMLEVRRSLPAWRCQDGLVDAINSNRVTIVCGETGSGKSTQSVQFILDDLIERRLGASANIVCTQPRRIAAIGLAERVAAERCSDIGKEVGYTIKGESKMSPETRISFVTTGVLLRRLQGNGDLEGIERSLDDVSHVVVDEVHERSVDTDFLLVLLKRMMVKRTDLKLVLMSATLDSQLFKDYFASFGVAIVQISGITFPVKDYYLEDVIHEISDNGRSGMSTGALIREAGMGINYSLIARLVDHIDIELMANDDNGSILIFLSGTAEISRTVNALQSPGIHALPLHAGLLSSEQRRVFAPAPKGKRKVIAATNVAETSLTISDVVAVIDTGRVKQPIYDNETGILRLADAWVSRAAAKQRRGRAGRVREGSCYKLYTESAAMKHMEERPQPEMQRVPLEQLCLTVRAMGISDIPAFLQSALSPPENVSIEGAIGMLRAIGAFDSHNQLTALGQHLASIPADLRCAKMMVYGALMGCLEPCLDVASILTVKSPFVSPAEKREESKNARKWFSADGNGDLVADMNAYQQFVKLAEKLSSNGLSRGAAIRELRSWCDGHFLSYQTLQDISSTKAQYVGTLKEMGLIPHRYGRDLDTDLTLTLNSNCRSTPLVRALIAAALHPQTARIEFPNKKFTAIASGSIEVDPEARQIKFFTRNNVAGPAEGGPAEGGSGPSTTRVFVHPSSTLFGASSFPSGSTFLSFWVKMQTSKLFIRDVTPVPALALLLFAGDVAIDLQGRGLVTDGWIKTRAWARIAALIGRLRSWLDRVLGGWIEGTRFRSDGQESNAVSEEDGRLLAVVRKLIELGGFDA